MRPYQPGQEFYNLIKTAIPDFVESEYPVFVEFITAFLRFLEQERVTSTANVTPEFGPSTQAVTVTDTLGGPLYEARKLADYRDTATSLDEFRTHFLAMFAKSFPEYSYVSTEWFVRSLRQFYQNKGTTDSIKWFFRAFFNEPADVYFPREDIFTSSGATWDAPLTIKVSEPTRGYDAKTKSAWTANASWTLDVTRYYVGQEIITTTGKGIVEAVRTYTVGTGVYETTVHELSLQYGSLGGTFSIGQELHNIDSTEQVYTTILSVIQSVIIIDGGTNYAIGDLVSEIGRAHV